ncbi:hypothetical protein CEXT_539781 [Caerostris extrusa]|uniref:Uncharacterized protein n=1 Tax=Caerostris extrusa TaxID=172846 RepID=A0AAV4QDH1_CAEEX|nr:hypothetical protein CEXT_539781 [Caerostris extrusa]
MEQARALELAEMHSASFPSSSNPSPVSTVKEGYIIENKTFASDPGKLVPLMNLPVPQTMVSLKRAMEMIAHYCHWIRKFSERIRSYPSKIPFPPF